MRFILAALLLLAPAARAATLTETIIINSAPSSAISCPAPATLTAPRAAGAVICTITITPAGWSGTLTLSGPNANLFAILPGASIQLVAGSAGITNAGQYSVTITSAP